MQYFYKSLSKDWGVTPGLARHLSVFGSAAVFGAAHNGAGFSATPFGAFGAGVYLGYTYMPEPGKEDLITAIALHAWWDIMVAYTVLNNSTFTESSSTVQVPLLSVAGNF